jgi:predicted acylesterase/phospholipase RssA
MGRGAAIVIGGAVAKGAFAAGALAVLTEKLTAKGTPIRRLVGTSSGALNATMLAAGVRAGDPVGATQKLTHLWEEKANVWGIIEPDLLSWLHGRGLSGTKRIIGLLKAECPTAVASPPVPVSLRIVVTPLAGVDRKGRIRSVARPRTSFEHVERFEGADLDDKEKRERVFQAAAASAAFPFAFEPVALQDVGPCVDGGVVNNTPIGEAIDQDPEIDAVYVIAADPADLSLKREDAAALGGSDLVLRLVEMLIDERLTRDLAEARAVNAWIETLKRLVESGGLTRTARDEVVHGLYPNRDPAAFRHVGIVEIRPAQHLKGNPFKGFFNGDLRHSYIEQGRAAAQAALR